VTENLENFWELNMHELNLTTANTKYSVVDYLDHRIHVHTTLQRPVFDYVVHVVLGVY
jgi:hypothetical protein